MSEELAQGGPPDAQRIMDEIRSSLQERRAQGIYTDAEADALAEARWRAYSEGVQIDPRLLQWLPGPGVEWNLAPGYAIQTTRTGFTAWLLVSVKQLVRPVVRLYTDPLVRRQAELNLYLVRLLHQNIRETARLELQILELRRRAQALRDKRLARGPVV